MAIVLGYPIPSWAAGDKHMKAVGWEKAIKLHKFFTKAWKDNEGELAAEFADMKINTHSRGGDFLELLEAEESKVKKSSKGSKVFYIPDDEYFTIHLFFGKSEDEIISRIKSKAIEYAENGKRKILEYENRRKSEEESKQLLFEKFAQYKDTVLYLPAKIYSTWGAISPLYLNSKRLGEHGWYQAELPKEMSRPGGGWNGIVGDIRYPELSKFGLVNLRDTEELKKWGPKMSEYKKVSQDELLSQVLSEHADVPVKLHVSMGGGNKKRSIIDISLKDAIQLDKGEKKLACKIPKGLTGPELVDYMLHQASDWKLIKA